MENIFFSILIAIVLAVGLTIVVLFPSYDEARKAEKKKSESANAAVKTARKLTVEEVAQHNAETDCWLIVKNKVYDVSSYVNDHPGGEAILNNAGGENTKGFYGPQHPRWAYERIEEYYIGDIVQ
ncbi:unnamed protein product [Calypogeia fissa]